MLGIRLVMLLGLLVLTGMLLLQLLIQMLMAMMVVYCTSMLLRDGWSREEGLVYL